RLQKSCGLVWVSIDVLIFVLTICIVNDRKGISILTREALLIVDMSNDFVHDDGGLTAGKPAQEIVPEIVRKADQFLENDDIVAVCMDAHEENDPHFELWPRHNV